MPILKEARYYVQGMHCPACEVLIEKKLAKQPGIKSAKASTGTGQVAVEYSEAKPESGQLNEIFKSDGYFFSDRPLAAETANSRKYLFMALGLALLLIAGFIALGKSGLSSLISVNSKSSLPAFFIFGLLAGVSSCAALVGGLVLAMSKQWSELYAGRASYKERFKPHLMFNIGRLVSYTVLGAILGAIGSALKLSLSFYSVLIFAVSAMMALLGLQMLGVKPLQRFQLRLPKFLAHSAADETKFQGRYMPFIMGALTFFLPCGFTIAAQGLALLSGNALQGGLIMLFFALGTLGPLLAIGLASVKLFSKQRWTKIFSIIAGILVLFFALYNVNAQLNVLGVASLNDLSITPKATQPENNKDSQAVQDGLAPIISGQQVIKMQASSSGYTPNNFKVRAGLPVRWEITDVGTSGCTSAVISKSLFDGQIDLTRGQTSVKEFTPAKAGTYKFSCWMGMVTGTIQVVEAEAANDSADSSSVSTSASQTFDSGAGSGGCGCGAGRNSNQ